MLPVSALSAGRLGELARKYQALEALRVRRDGEGPPATRAELRSLAAEFPGCLRELDTLGGGEISRRAAACAAAAGGGPTEPWMAWIAAYHDLIAERLAARVRGTETDPRSGPPVGRERLNATVLRALAARFGVPATTIARALFPVRRPSPYQL